MHSKQDRIDVFLRDVLWNALQNTVKIKLSMNLYWNFLRKSTVQKLYRGRLEKSLVEKDGIKMLVHKNLKNVS